MATKVKEKEVTIPQGQGVWIDYNHTCHERVFPLQLLVITTKNELGFYPIESVRGQDPGADHFRGQFMGETLESNFFNKKQLNPILEQSLLKHFTNGK